MPENNIKEQKQTAINVCLKESSNLKIQSLLDTAKKEYVEIKPLFDPHAKVVEHLRDLPQEDKFNESKVFEQLYEKMSESEKKLYRIWNIRFSTNIDAENALKLLKGNPAIEFAELDQLNELYWNPNDSYYVSNQLWGINKIQSNIAWDYTKGEGIIIAVIDTGVDKNHPDIAANMWTNSLGQNGYDFSDGDSNPNDYHGHGTHVAGTIAGIGNNAIGVIGVAPKAKIMSVKIFPNAYDSIISQALKYAVDNGAKILNNSWGPSSRRPSNPVVEAAINYVYSKGGICVFAAGNKDDDTAFYSPANYNKVISVAASTQSDQRASFSNFGNVVELAAPGKDIISLQKGTTGYVSMSGTSMAAPHVCGAAALLLSLSPKLSFENVKYFLTKSATQISTDKPIGTGRLNCLNLIVPPVSVATRSSIISANSRNFAVNNNGDIVKFYWGGSWQTSTIPHWGPKIKSGSLVEIDSGLIAGVNEMGQTIVTWGNPNTPQFAIIHQTFGIIPGTLRYSTSRYALFAITKFGDIAYIKWHGSSWHMNIIAVYGSPLIPRSLELSDDRNQVYCLNSAKQAVLTWGDNSQAPMPDGARIGFAIIAQTSNLLP